MPVADEQNAYLVGGTAVYATFMDDYGHHLRLLPGARLNVNATDVTDAETDDIDIE